LTDRKVPDKKEYGESTLVLFREIKSAVDKTTGKEGESCALVTAIEKTVGKDPRTVRLHLKILEESGYGHFSSGGKLFCKSASQGKDQNRKI
jgi:DNA-binding transcriptional ArsR family regulator